jgi:C-terminal processing protease CtpA/Prc
MLMAAASVTGLDPATAQAATVTFGVVAGVNADGIFNPRLKSVLIQSVEPGGPAAAACIAAGDGVVEVEGRPVDGAAASEMSHLMNKAPGQTLMLKLKREGGEPYVVELTAVARP